MITYKIFTILSFISIMFCCSDNKRENKIPLEQINFDNSTNYRYIFREDIEKEKANKKTKINKNQFND